MARVAQQELHWADALKEMKTKKQYHMVDPNLNPVAGNIIIRTLIPNQSFLPYILHTRTQIGVNKI